MFSQWRSRTLDRIEAKRRAIERIVPLRRRLDAILLSLLGLLLVCVVALGVMLANGHMRFGWFDPDPIQPLPDDRLVTNIRDETAQRAGAFVAASYQESANRLSILREKGLLHSVNLKTGVWSDDTSLDEVTGINSAFVDLSPACPTQSSKALSHCADKTGLFAYSADGGLVVRDKAGWRTVLPDSRFIGASGEAVQHDDLVNVVVSANKRWLLLATKADGLGLFDLVHRNWVPIPVAKQQAILGDETLKAPSHMVAFGDEILLGTQKGLMAVSFGDDGQVGASGLVSDGLGTILDMTVFEKDALILASNACEGGACLALYRYEASGELKRLFGETQLYPELSQAGLSRALVAEDGKTILMLGEAGIYRYDRVQRDWQQLLDEAVSTYLEDPSVNGIYFAIAGKVGLLERSGKITFWPLAGQSVTSLARTGAGALLVQTASNQTWRIAGDEVVMLNDGAAAKEPLANMKRAVSAFNRLVMIGDAYLVLHDIRKRSYVSIPRASLSPGLLFGAETQLFGSDEILWGLSGDELEAWRLAGNDSEPSLERLAHTWLSSGPRSVHKDGDALLFVDAEGRPFRARAIGHSIQIKGLLGEVDAERGPVRDVISQGDLTYLARDRRVSVYSLKERGFVDTLSMPLNEDIREIARVGDALYLLGSNGSLVEEGRGERLTGSNKPFSFPSAQIFDAMSNGEALFLASGNDVTSYSPTKRSVTNSLRFDATGPLRFAGLAGSVPIVYDGRNAWFGDESLAIDGARVLSASKVGEDIASVQYDGAVTFLVRHSIKDGAIASPSCYYRNPGPAGEDIIDVAAVPDVGVVSLVGNSLWLRDQPHRRFVGFTLSASNLPRNARISVIDDYLVVHNEQEAWIVALAQLRTSDSCSRVNEDLTNETTRLSADQLAVSKSGNLVGLLYADGEYRIWKGGGLSVLIPAMEGPQPVPQSFQSVAQIGKALYFADDRSIWRYDSIRREWSSTVLPTIAGRTAKVDVWAKEDGLVVTQSYQGGPTLGAVVDPGLSSIPLARLDQWGMSALPIAPEAIKDVVRLSNGNWLYLTDNAAVITEAPDQPNVRVSAPIALPFAAGVRSVDEQNGQIVISDGKDEAATASLLIIDLQTAFVQEDRVPAHFSYQPERGETVTVLADKQLIRQSANGDVSLCHWNQGQTALSRCIPYEPQQGNAGSLELREEQGQIVIKAGSTVVARLEGQLGRIKAPTAATASVQWDRDKGAFSFLDADGSRFWLPAGEALPDGRFAFAAPGRAVMLNAAHYMVANRYGVWVYQTGAEPSLRWRRMTLPEDFRAVGKGRIYFADGRSIGPDDPYPVQANAEYAVSLGALDVKAKVGGGILSAYWSDGLKIYKAFSEHGFFFDEKRDVAFSDGQAWFLTPVGLVSADDLGRTMPLPSAQSILMTSVGDRLFALEGRKQWLVLDVMGWQRADNPFADRQIAYDQDLVWLYQNGRLITRSTTRTMSAERRLGLRFESDILFDAAFSKQGLVVRLGDGVRQYSGFDGLSATVDAKAELPSGLRLAVRPMRDGERQVVAVTRRGAISRRWNGEAFERVAYDDNPDIERIAASMDWLRVRFVAGKPSVELKTEMAGFEDGWTSVAWNKGEPMPMDRFLSIYGRDGVLYAGSPVGVQLLKVEDGRIASQRFVELGRGSASHEAVFHIGAYRNGRAPVYALGAKHCLAIDQGVILPCERGDDVSIEDLGGNDFWHWERKQGRILLGYSDGDGQPLGAPFALSPTGRFPHDQLDDIIRCGETLAQSWHGNFTALDETFGLGQADAPKAVGDGRKGRSLRFLKEGAVALSCQPETVAPSASEPQGLPAGLYIEAGDFWRWSREGLEPANGLAEALAARKDNRIAYQAERMRVRNAKSGVLFDYRDKDQWRLLAFAGGRLAIDERQGLVSAKGQIWSYSPEGFSPVAATDGTIDPDHFVLYSLKVAADVPACRFDRAQTVNDGSSQLSLVDENGDEPITLLRCQDGRLWQGQLDGIETDTPFTLRQDQSDPFETRRIVGDAKTGIWLIGRTAGREGTLQFRWHGEDNGLSGGRFALDAIRQIAQIEPKRIDMMTGLGWVRQPVGRWEAESGMRAANDTGLAASIRSFGADADVDRVLDRGRVAIRSLCLEDENGRFHRWRSNGQLDQVEACDALLADDGQFAYRDGEGALRITAASLNGSKMVRRLVDGHFSDLVARGHAVLSHYEGAPVIAIGSEKRVNLFDPDRLEWLGAWALTRDPQTLFLDEAGDIGAVFEKGRSDMRGQASSFCKGFDVLRERLGRQMAGKLRGFEVMGGRAYVDILDEKGALQTMAFDCEDAGNALVGDVAELEDRIRYLSNFELWGRPAALLSLLAGPENMLVSHIGDKQAAVGALSSRPLFMRRIGERFVILDSSEIYQADLDALLSYTIEQGARHE